MSYDKDHELDHDYAGEAAFERWEREQELTRARGGDTDDPDALPKGYEDHLVDGTRYRLTFVLPGMWRRSF